MLCNQVDYYFQLTIRSLKETVPQLTQAQITYNLPDCLSDEWHDVKKDLLTQKEVWEQDPLVAEKHAELEKSQTVLKEVIAMMDNVRKQIATRVEKK